LAQGDKKREKDKAMRVEKLKAVSHFFFFLIVSA
jgi:hypothetical protein